MARVRVGHNSRGAFVEDEALSLPERGYEFQFRSTKAILDKLAGFSTVTLRDMAGNTITLDNYRRRGRDGGLDLVIEVDAKTPAAAKAVATRVRSIILALEIE